MARTLPCLLTIGLLASAAVGGGAAPASAAMPYDPPVRPGSDRAPIAGGVARIADPAGRGAWTLSVGRTPKGQLCAKVVRRDGRTVTGTCAWIARPGATSTRILRRGARTFVYGVVGSGVRRVEVLGPHGRPVVLTPRGRGFAAVLAGRLPDHSLPVRVTLADRTTRVQDWGAGEVVEALDPFNGRRWLLRVPAAQLPTHTATCATDFPADQPEWPSGQFVTNHGTCFDLRRSAFGVVRLPRGEHGVVGPGGPPPTRTVVFGVVRDDVAMVELLTPAGPRRLELSARGRGFIAVLAGDDPSPIRVTLQDGTVETAAGNHALSGQWIA